MQNPIAYKPKSTWEVYHTKSDRMAMRHLVERYIDFVSHCKTERETVTYVQERLQEAGFNQGFCAEQPQGYAVLRGKTLFAARRGQALEQGLRIISAHTDSPRLDLKQHPLTEQVGIGQAKTHYYGGIHKYQWLARPLALHGVIVRSNGELITVCLGEQANEPVFTIADLLPHLAQKQSSKTVSEAFEAEKLNIVLGHQPLEKASPEAEPAEAIGEKIKAKAVEQKEDEALGENDEEDKNNKKEPIKAHILQLLYEKYGICEEDLFSAELQAVPAGPARFVGLDSALVGAYGQDDRVCVFTALEAFLDATSASPADAPSIGLILWDKEEIGSESSTGANSRFFEYCLQDMLAAWAPELPFRKLMLASRALSADVHAATDPDWQDLHEKLNASIIGNGPTFCKFTGSRGKYGANDAHPEYIGWLRNILAERGIPWQMAELGKVDHGGGGTVALYLAAYGMDVIDMGPSLLGMHSPFELASVPDIYATKLAYQAFFEVTL